MKYTKKEQLKMEDISGNVLSNTDGYTPGRVQ